MIFVAAATGIYFSFRVFSVDLSLITGSVIAAITTIAGAVKLIPGNLGVKEAIITAIADVEVSARMKGHTRQVCSG